ncbi:MAG: tetratricopeptide repeat protein [Roseiarcus sp.]
MRASLNGFGWVGSAQLACQSRRKSRSALIAAGLFFAGTTAVLALDSSPDSKPPAKLSPKTFTSAHEALQAGVDDLRAGDAKSSVQALTYAAEGGEPLARWKLGSMYASGEFVPRNDLMAYKYFEQLVDSYDEDALDHRDIGAISNAFVEVGVYNLTGIPNSEITPDPEHALEMFQFAATNFGDPEAQYRLARMYLDGAGGLAKDNMRAARWLQLAADKGHHGAQAMLGHLLFTGDGVPIQRGRGLMWLWIAKSSAKGPNDGWIHDLQVKDYNAASEDDRQISLTYLGTRGKDLRELTGGPRPPAVTAPPMRLSGAIAPVGAIAPGPRPEQ